MLKLNLPLVGSADDSMDADSDGDEGERENGGGDGRGGGGGCEIGRGDEGGEEGGEQSGEEEEEGGGRRDFWKKFSELVVQLRSLQLLHFIADSAVAEVVYCKVRGFLASTTPFLLLIPLPPHFLLFTLLSTIFLSPLHSLPYTVSPPLFPFTPFPSNISLPSSSFTPLPSIIIFLLFILLPNPFSR